MRTMRDNAPRRSCALGRAAMSTGTESVWLECSGAALDVRSIEVVGIREPMPGVELVQFACPQCHALHESLRFG